MRILAGDIRSWAVLAVLSLIVGLIGPFGTFEMPIATRLAYWTAIVAGTSTIGTLFASVIERLIAPRTHWLVRALIAGGVAGLPIAAAVALVNVAAFGPRVQPLALATLAIYCVLISAAVTVLTAIFELRPRAATTTASTSPALLDRLPLPQRGRLLHLEVADHYVQIATDRGSAMLLIRLSDAIRETAPVRGLQVHRSHWVALDAVRKASRQAGKPVLELENGTIVPISRSFLADARAAGLVT